MSFQLKQKIDKIYETISFKILDLRQPREMGNKQGEPYDCTGTDALREFADHSIGGRTLDEPS